MRAILLAGMALVALSGTVLADCWPEKVFKRDGGHDPLGASTVQSSSGTTWSFAASSGTSGCGDESKADAQAVQLVADAGEGLEAQVARGEGGYLRALSALMGCGEETHPVFARHAQAFYATLYPAEMPMAEDVVARLRRMIAADAALAAACARSAGTGVIGSGEGGPAWDKAADAM